MALTNLINVSHAKWQYVKRTLIFIVKMPYNGIVKNAHEDIKSGGANFFWKYPLILSMCCYPVPFYYHESKKISPLVSYSCYWISKFLSLQVSIGDCRNATRLPENYVTSIISIPLHRWPS